MEVKQLTQVAHVGDVDIGTAPFLTLCSPFTHFVMLVQTENKGEQKHDGDERNFQWLAMVSQVEEFRIHSKDRKCHVLPIIIFMMWCGMQRQKAGCIRPMVITCCFAEKFLYSSADNIPHAYNDVKDEL